MTKEFYFLFLFLSLRFSSNSQSTSLHSEPRQIFSSLKDANGNVDLYGTKSRFVSNVGQYGDTLEGYGCMGKILFAFEGFDMPVYLTEHGLIYLQRKIEKPSEEEKEEMENKGMNEDDISKKTIITDRIITTAWLNSNPNTKIIAEDLAEGYSTYGSIPKIAYSYKTITYKEIYPGVDLIYSFIQDKKDGFEYRFNARPNADLSLLKLKIGGDVKSIKNDKDGNLFVRTDINGVMQSIPESFYGDEFSNKNISEKINSRYAIHGSTISFVFDNYDKSKNIILDPFITATASLIGTNNGKAKDVDFDYAGNVYVSGGGDGFNHKIAKYDASGILQWTFIGTIPVPAWSFGPYYGGWVVEKSTGNVYLGQGFSPATGYMIVRLNASGIYDNYISTGNPGFNESWKLFWSCNNGSPQIMIVGGGTSSNLNLGLLTPPSTVVTPMNITGIPSSCCQDMVDMMFDPATFDIYSIFASLGGTPVLNNKIYKNPAPYSGANIAWNVASGFAALSEANNRPYMALVTAGLMDNSANVLALNSQYLFYYDGINLKAFNKATGAGVGTPIVLPGANMMEGGIEADECNNIFVGSINGTIKVYHFTGSIFDDAAAPDISIAGFTTKSVYDLVINDGQKLLYACGDGFVASFDISTFGCGSNVYSIGLFTDCVNHTATASLNPAPPINSTITYILYNGLTQVASNTNGVFTGLTQNINYTIHAFVNQACSGTESISNFTIVGPALSVTQSNTTCGLAIGSIAASATGGIAPISYSIDNITFQSSGNFNGLAAGIYIVTVKDVTGCASSSTVNVINTNGPTVSLTKVDAFCGSATGSITATGANGTAPYQYSINGTTFQASTIFSGLASGTYFVTIKDASNCINTTAITLISIGNTLVSANSVAANCGNSNGSITANVTGGSSPYSYSINGTTYQNGNVFAGLAPGNYSITVKDASNCINIVAATIANIAGPQISATATPTSCNSFTGVVTVTATGVFPLQYSINGGTTFQASNVFTSISVGTYSVLVKDANGCLNSISVVVNLSIPQVTDSTTVSACGVNNGTITAIGAGGITPYLYSINGTTFQSSNVFSGIGAGTYTLTIKDAANCTNAVSPVIVNNAGGLTVSATTTTTSCVTSTGSITVTANGGQVPMQYSINGVTFQSGNNFTALASGTYTVTAKDANNCTATISINVNKISGPIVTATATSTTCNASTGIITATGSSGSLPYTYSINGITFFSNNIFSGLSPGPYTVTIKDANLCTSTTAVLIANIGGGSGPSVTATVQAAECGQANGRINGNGSGGQNPKQYSLDGVVWQGSTNFQALLPGTYTLYVRDANGCINFIVVTVPNIAGPQVSATVTSSSCGSSNGTITATGFGGTPVYRFSIDGGITFQTSNSFTGLAGGFYTLTVRDANNVCRNSIIVYIPNSNGPSVAFSKTDATCATNNGTITANGSGGVAPLNYSLDGINFQSSNLFVGLSTGQYPLTIKDATGCSNSLTVTVNNIAMPQVAVSPVSATCGNSNASITVSGTSGASPYQYSLNGTTFQSSNLFSSLAAGNFLITLKDANNCIVSTNVTLANVPGPQLATNTISTTCGNNNGLLIITGSNGTQPYQYSINGTTFQTSFVFTGLSNVSGTVFIKDANNCIASAPYLINATSMPSVTAIDTSSSCGAGTIVATGAGGANPYQYSLNGVLFQSSNAFTCVLPGTYVVTVKDANGCLSTTTIIVNNPLPVSLLYFNAVANKTEVELIWVTASELNNDYFTIERSKDAQKFETVLIHDGIGNSSSLSNYFDRDFHPIEGISYYRLKQTDLSGNNSFSKNISVNFKEEGISVLSYFSQENKSINILIKDNFDTDEVIELFDITGRKIYKCRYQNDKYITINTSNLSKGIYTLKVFDQKQQVIKKIEVF